MSPSIEFLKTKFAALLQAIATGLAGKLDNDAAAVSADKLTNPFQLSATGDVLGAVNIQGNSNVAWGLSLSDTGVAAGSYPKVTVNAKGRVIGGSLLLAGDIPNLDASKVNSGVFATARIPTLNQNTTGNAATASKLAASRTIAMTGDGTWSVSGDLGTNLSAVFTLAATGAVAGTYGSASAIPRITIDDKGRVIEIQQLPVDIPASTVIAVNEYVTVAEDAVKQYDLQTVIGAGYADFDMKTAEISIRAKDTNASSPMFNAYANPEALVSYGVRDERYVVIANQSGAAIELYVKVLVHPF